MSKKQGDGDCYSVFFQCLGFTTLILWFLWVCSIANSVSELQEKIQLLKSDHSAEFESTFNRNFYSSTGVMVMTARIDRLEKKIEAIRLARYIKAGEKPDE